MCKIYNQVGSLTAIKAHLQKNNVNDFHSINELLDFQANYSKIQQKVFSKHSVLIEEEKQVIKREIAELEALIERVENEIKIHFQHEIDNLNNLYESLLLQQANRLEKCKNYIKRINIKRKIKKFKRDFKDQINISIQPPSNTLNNKLLRLEFISRKSTEAVNESSHSDIKELERKKLIINELNSTIYGAIGEQKVSVELGKLTDEYVLINDFNCSFYPAIYNRNENDYIKSIQIDHLLISPAGIFIIETKNWSEHSLKNISLRSPVEQIKRSGYAMYKMLEKGLIQSLQQHHWGDKKIPLRNIIVFIEHKPNEEFQHVKILKLIELRNYIEYFKPSLSKIEVEKISNYLLRNSKVS